jgi:hypothetical protein
LTTSVGKKYSKEELRHPRTLSLKKSLNQSGELKGRLLDDERKWKRKRHRLWERKVAQNISNGSQLQFSGLFTGKITDGLSSLELDHTRVLNQSHY